MDNTKQKSLNENKNAFLLNSPTKCKLLHSFFNVSITTQKMLLLKHVRTPITEIKHEHL